MGAVDVMVGMNARTPDRRVVAGLRRVPGEEQRVDFRLSPANVQTRIDDDKREERHKPPKAAAVGVGGSNPDNISPRSFPSDSGIQHKMVGGCLAPPDVRRV